MSEKTTRRGLVRAAGRRAHQVAAVVATLLALSMPSAAAAAASDPSDGGMWYFTGTAMEALHQRTTGEGVTIAVLDDPVSPHSPDLAGTDVQVIQPSYCALTQGGQAVPAPTSGPLSRHGTHIVALILGTGAGIGGEPGVRGVAPGASVISYTVRSVSEDGSCFNTDQGSSDDQAFRDAIAAGADIINVSGSLLTLSEDAFAEAVRAGVIVVAAAGNDGGTIYAPPAVFNGAVSVGTIAPDMTLDPGSAHGPELGVIAPGAEIRCTDPTFTMYGRCTGSSDAAAYTSGVLALAISAFPDATPNQILQALVHSANGDTTATPTHDDLVGYGSVNARALLDTDPTTYPDTNPFIREDEGARPAATELRTPAPDDESDNPVAASGDTADPDQTARAGTVTTVAVVSAVLAAVVLGGAIITAVVVARRRAGAPTGPGQAGPRDPSEPTRRQG